MKSAHQEKDGKEFKPRQAQCRRLLPSPHFSVKNFPGFKVTEKEGAGSGVKRAP